MSLRRDPFSMARNWWQYDLPQRIFDQHFCRELLEDDLLPAGYSLNSLRPRRLHSRQESGVSEIRQDKEKFEVLLDVQQFHPSELNVKTTDNCVVVEGKHEEKKDEHGFITRQFTRKYILPEETRPETVSCNFSSDGVLIITALRKQKEQPGNNERSVPIMPIGTPIHIAKAEDKAKE